MEEEFAVRECKKRKEEESKTVFREMGEKEEESDEDALVNDAVEEGKGGVLKVGGTGDVRET